MSIERRIEKLEQWPAPPLAQLNDSIIAARVAALVASNREQDARRARVLEILAMAAERNAFA